MRENSKRLNRRRKHRKNCKTLPFEHLISCQCVKLFLLSHVTITAFTITTVPTVTKIQSQNFSLKIFSHKVQSQNFSFKIS